MQDRKDTVLASAGRCVESGFEGEIKMARFNRRLFGYRREEVDRYFTALEQEQRAAEESKTAELNRILEQNIKLQAEIRSIAEEIEKHNQKKLQSVNSLTGELTALEIMIQKSQDEAREKKLAAVQKMQAKRNEVVYWYEVLKECRANLMDFKERYQREG